IVDLSFRVAARRPYDDGEQDRKCHYRGDDVERAPIICRHLTHACDVKRTKYAGEAPGREHEAVNRPDILRAEIVRRERRHRSKPAPVTHQDDERDESHQQWRGDPWQNEKEHDLKNKHDRESRAPRDQIGSPRPENASHSVAEACYADYAAGDDGAYAGEFLKNRSFLRD